VNVDRFLLDHVVGITRTLAHGAVFPPWMSAESAAFVLAGKTRAALVDLLHQNARLLVDLLGVEGSGVDIFHAVDRVVVDVGVRVLPHHRYAAAAAAGAARHHSLHHLLLDAL